MAKAKELSSLKEGSHIHLMGICGTAMASLAGLLKSAGFRVSGSDEQAYPPMSTQLEELGIEIMKGYRKENLNPRPDLVIVGNVIRRDMEEAQALEDNDILYTSLPQALAEFVIRDRQSVVIAGTHGKTTSTAMTAWCLKSMGFDPGYLVGGIPLNFNRSFSMGNEPYFVIEGDEYDTAFFDKVPKFVHYKPRHVILTSIEFDHADIYSGIEEVKKAFANLVKLIPSEGSLIYAYGDPNIRSVLEASNFAPERCYSFGFSEPADYRLSKLQRFGLSTKFEVNFRGEKVGDFELKLIADYNLMNALGLIALGHSLGWSMPDLKKALLEFKGVKRRQEILGEPAGVMVIEDFAHHPTAVSHTIRAVKQAFPERRLFSIFEPRSATSRRKIFQQAYTEAFKASDVSIISEPYDQSRIAEADRFSTKELIGDIERSGGTAKSFKDVDGILSELDQQLRQGDIVLIMSNGGFGGIYSKLLASLSEKSKIGV